MIVFISLVINHLDISVYIFSDQSLKLLVINHIRKDASMLHDQSLRLLVIDHVRRTFLVPYTWKFSRMIFPVKGHNI